MGLFNLFKKKGKEIIWDKTMQVLFCFKANTLTVGDVLDLVDKSKEFVASAVSRERDFEVLTATRHHELKNADKETNDKLFAEGLIFLDQHNRQRVYIETFAGTDKYQQLYWSIDSLQFLESPLFRELIAHPNFIVAYCYNRQDNQRQNTYERQFEEIANNPGKFFVMPRAYLVSAWKSWIGKNFYDLVDKERIRQFDKAYSIEEFDNGVTCVQLYNNHEDFRNPENRQIQQSFKEWMGYKKLHEASQ